MGETVETAIWLDGRETPALRARFEHDSALFLDEVCHLSNVQRGPVRWTVLRPGDDRVPDVPDHIQGPDVRLLVAEADILAATPHLSAQARSFIGDLDQPDLLRLREITRKSSARHYRRILSDLECDDIIDQVGLEAALDTLRDGTVH